MSMISRETRLKNLRDMTPFQRLCHWINERETIRLAKEAGEPKPWTYDPILQTYRFCNVRRMDDRVSQWLLKNWYEPHFDHPNMLLACALARFFNKEASLSRITGMVFRDGKRPDWSAIKKCLRKYRDGGGTVFNGAYVVRGNDGIDKIECVVDYYVKPLVTRCQLNVADTITMQHVHGLLHEQYGFGSFMAGQVVADMRWAISGGWTDRGYWAPMGPGSKRGMNRLLGRGVNDPLSQEEFLENLQQMIGDCCNVLPASITDRLEAIDWQSCLCEQDKFCRAIFDEGTPKQKYQGV